MARPKKKNSNPALSMEELLKKVVEAYKEPYDDRDEREAGLPSLRSVADELNTTILRTRKLLITAEFYSTTLSRTVQEMAEAGVGIEEIMEKTGLGKASINSYLPYKNLAFNLEQTTVNADRHRVFRKRGRVVEELKQHLGLPGEEVWLWKCICAFQGYPFSTSGRGSRPGSPFKYSVSSPGSAGGRHYKGEEVEGFGNEMWITTAEGEKKKSISRSTVEIGYKRARELGVVKGPKALGIPGAGSYLWPVFLRLGVCTSE